MKIKKAELTAVAVRENHYPAEDMPEIAFAGRSNVGKSSLFNTLVNRRNFARVSGSPGKTRTINFFEINGEFRIVDLPGYGYAKVSKSQSKEWGPMMENYLENRSNLLKVVQLVDVRHAPSAQDVQMYDYLRKSMTRIEGVRSTQTFYNDKTLDSEIDDYDDDIDKWDEKLQNLEDKYYDQFSKMESAMAKLQSQQSYLSSLFGSAS